MCWKYVWGILGVCFVCVGDGVKCETIAADPRPRTTGTGFLTMHNQGTNNSHNVAQITITAVNKSQTLCCTNHNHNVAQITAIMLHKSQSQYCTNHTYNFAQITINNQDKDNRDTKSTMLGKMLARLPIGQCPNNS